MAIYLRAVWVAVSAVLAMQCSAAQDCMDVYKAKLAVKPAGEKYWLSPDRNFNLELPATHSAKAGGVEILVSVKRKDKSALIAEFTLITPKGREAFLTRILMDQEDPKVFADSLVSTTGSEFSLSLEPTCWRI